MTMNPCEGYRDSSSGVTLRLSFRYTSVQSVPLAIVFGITNNDLFIGH